MDITRAASGKGEKGTGENRKHGKTVNMIKREDKRLPYDEFMSATLIPSMIIKHGRKLYGMSLINARACMAIDDDSLSSRNIVGIHDIGVPQNARVACPRLFSVARRGSGII